MSGLERTSGETLKLIVMSDLHLVPDGEVCNGLDTGERLAQAIASVNSDHADADLVVLAGDLADRGEAAAYARLKTQLDDLTVPWCLTLGNHDDRPTFLSAFGKTGSVGAPSGEIGANPQTDCIDSALDLKGTRLIVLDSSEPGQVGGVLTPAQLSWLAARLDEAAGRPVIVVLHHHAQALRLPVDEIWLANAEAFVEVLQGHQVRQVIAGHVHLPTTGLWRGIPFTTIAGGHYSVTPHLASVPGRQGRTEGPGQYAVVLSDAEGTLVHFHDFLDRHLRLADGLFGWRKRAAEAAAE
ncbi:MAG: metallophosphoesterase [Pseudomonadota bacterium]